MANILITWEMGGNLGHLSNVRTLVELASRQGHTVSVALRNLRFADQVLGGLDYRCFQAPFRQPTKPRHATQCRSYAHTIEDYCFSDGGELACHISAWQEIFAAARPDVVFYDYSPGALIASHGHSFGKVVFGNGFFSPPTVPVSGVFAPFVTTPRDEATLQVLRQNDQRMLKILNEGCRRRGVPPFADLAGIYTQADLTLRTTLPELDQFGAREDGNYLGVQPSFASAGPAWPTAGADKVFCYLQDFPGAGTLLQELCASQLTVLVYSRDLPAALREQFRKHRNIGFTDKPVNLEAVAREASFVVHHANHGTVAQFFLYGVPQLSIPTQQEQLLTALQLDRAGVGVTALHDQRSFAADIRQLLQKPGLRKRARHFQQRHAEFTWQQSEARIQEELRSLLEKSTQ